MSLFSVLTRPVLARLNPVNRRLAYGAFWALTGTVAARALAIPVSVLLARYMGPARYGELGIINTSIDLFMVFAGFGLGSTANKHTAQYRTTDPDRAGRILALSNATGIVTGAGFATVLFFLAPWLAGHSLAAPQLAPSLRIGSLILLVAAINGAQSGALYGFEAFKVSAWIQTVVGVMSVPLMVAGYFIADLNGVLWGMVSARVLDCSMRAYALRVEARRAGIKIRYSHCALEFGLLWRFSLPAVLAGSMVSPVSWLCASMLVSQPGGYREMGIYSAANAWYGALLFLPTALGSALLPVLSERMGHDDRQSAAGALSAMLRLNAAIVIPGAIVLALASPYIMQLYGSAYSHAAPTLVVAVLTAAIYAILMPVGDVISASGKMWMGFAMNTGWAAAMLSGTWLLIPWGAFGLALARLTAYAIHAAWAGVFAAGTLRAHVSSNATKNLGGRVHDFARLSETTDSAGGEQS